MYEIDNEGYEFEIAFAALFGQVSDQIGRIPDYFEFKLYFNKYFLAKFNELKVSKKIELENLVEPSIQINKNDM